MSYLVDWKMWKRPFWDCCAEHLRETFIVPGNHEFYGRSDIGLLPELLEHDLAEAEDEEE